MKVGGQTLTNFVKEQQSLHKSLDDLKATINSDKTAQRLYINKGGELKLSSNWFSHTFRSLTGKMTGKEALGQALADELGSKEMAKSMFADIHSEIEAEGEREEMGPGILPRIFEKVGELNEIDTEDFDLNSNEHNDLTDNFQDHRLMGRLEGDRLDEALKDVQKARNTASVAAENK